MSQEKVDRYKKEKANRKKTMRREKILNGVRTAVICVAAVGIVGWVGYSAYGVYEDNRGTETVEINYDAFDELEDNVEYAED